MGWGKDETKDKGEMGGFWWGNEKKQNELINSDFLSPKNSIVPKNIR